MMTRISLISFLLLFSTLFAGCNEPVNPLIGQWQQLSPTSHASSQIIEFTPSTMRINDQAVTVVYQMRDNKVRVSASKSAIIYEFDDANSIHYEDEKNGTIKLIRVKP
ncbi:MAG: hypothetical protein WBM38_15665 [Arenicellales bacterium]|jgi:hypothetical protein